MNRLASETNVLVLVRGEDRYVILYDDASQPDALRLLGRWATTPELSFTWHDAVVLAHRIRKGAKNDVSLEFFGRVLLLMSKLFDNEPKTADQLERIRKALAAAEAAYKEKAA